MGRLVHVLHARRVAHRIHGDSASEVEVAVEVGMMDRITCSEGEADNE